jgi:hypothetical protein
MIAMIAALERADPHRQGLTTSEIVEKIRHPVDPIPEWHADLKSAVEELCGRLDGRVLGYRFRHFARRNFGGKVIDRAGGGHGNVIRWAVFPVGRSGEPSPPSPPPTDRRPERPEGDGGDGGHVPPPVDPGRVEYRNDDRPHEYRNPQDPSSEGVDP